MSAQILRYPFRMEPGFPASMFLPLGARFLHFDYQPAKRCFSLWFQADPGHHKVGIDFIVLPTGADVPEHSEYYGTTLVDGGETVWHLYGRNI